MSTAPVPGLNFSTILASSVHDMKNSLGMLLNSIEFIVDEIKPANEEQAAQFKILQYEASRINGELIQLLTLYRMDNNFLPVQIDEHYVNDVIEEQLARNQMLINSSSIEVMVDCSEDLAWYFDVDLIGGVFHNVLVNTLRYTHKTLQIRAMHENGFLKITLEDDGPGYPEALLEQPSYLKEVAEFSKGNTHLGFYFAECIAQVHKRDSLRGSIALDNNSSLGGGRFTLLLP